MGTLGNVERSAKRIQDVSIECSEQGKGNEMALLSDKRVENEKLSHGEASRRERFLTFHPKIAFRRFSKQAQHI